MMPRSCCGRRAGAVLVLALAAAAAPALPPALPPAVPPAVPLAVPPAPAPVAQVADEDITPESQHAVERALRWLAGHQNEDGSWTAAVGFKLNQSYEVTAAAVPHVGVTALAGLAFLSAGQIPGRGEFGDTIRRATDFVLSCVNDEGFITAHDTRMYSHAFSTLFLAEVYGMTDRQDVREKLQSAVDFIVECQNEEGAWRYLPFAVESDMSIAVCQLNALRGARNVGIRVPRSTIDRAARYVARSYDTRDDRSYYGDRGDLGDYYRSGPGSFRYQVGGGHGGSRSSFALTAAGIAALHNAGAYGLQLTAPDGSPIDLSASIDFLLDTVSLVSADSRYQFHYFYWYGHYYATQALYVIGGKAWRSYYPRLRDELVGSQAETGSFPCRAGPGEAFSTAIGAMILSLPYGYLPIFQR